MSISGGSESDHASRWRPALSERRGVAGATSVHQVTGKRLAAWAASLSGGSDGLAGRVADGMVRARLAGSETHSFLRRRQVSCRASRLRHCGGWAWA